MATTLTVQRTTPSTLLLRFNTDGTPGEEAYFQKSGAPAGSVDLNDLVPGNLRTYLERLPNWYNLFAVYPSTNDRVLHVEWSFPPPWVDQGLTQWAALVDPDTGLGQANSPRAFLSAADIITFQAGFTGTASDSYVGLRFVHSLGRG